MEKFNERLKRILLERKINQTKLGEIIGIKQATISTWVLGKSVPEHENLALLSKGLDLTPQYLLYGHEPETDNSNSFLDKYEISKEELLEFFEWKKQKAEEKINKLKQQ